MSSYPEHDKMAAVKTQSQTIGEFLDRLYSQNLHIGKWEPYRNNGETRYIPADEEGEKKGCLYMHEDSEDGSRCYTNLEMYAMRNPNFQERREGCYQYHRRIEQVLADYFEIDLKKIDREKDAMLDAMRKSNGIE